MILFQVIVCLAVILKSGTCGTVKRGVLGVGFGPFQSHINPSFNIPGVLPFTGAPGGWSPVQQPLLNPLPPYHFNINQQALALSKVS